jgi:hypothetical protein
MPPNPIGLGQYWAPICALYVSIIKRGLVALIYSLRKISGMSDDPNRAKNACLRGALNDPKSPHHWGERVRHLSHGKYDGMKLH